MRYELKPRTISEILDGTFKLYRDHFAPLLVIAAVGSIPTVVFTSVSEWLTKASKISGPGAFGPQQVAVLVSLPFVLVAATLQYCALTSAAIDAYLGRPFTAGAAILKALSRFWSLLWASFLFYLGVGGGIVVCGAAAAVVIVVGLVSRALLVLGFGTLFLGAIIVGVYLTLIWSLWLQALVFEDKRGASALGRSYQLTKGATGRLGWLVLAFVAVQLAIVLGFHAAVPSQLEGMPFIGTAIEQIPSVVLAPIYPALLTLFYFDGRIRHEGFDLEMKATEGLPAATASALP